MNSWFLFTSILFFAIAINNLFFWVSVWQKYDYNSARVWFYLTRTTKGRKSWLSLMSVVEIVAIFLYTLVVFDESITPFYHAFISMIIALHCILMLGDLFKGTARLPEITHRTMYICITTLFILCILYYNPLIDPYLWLLVLYRCVVFVLLLSIFSSAFPVEIYRDLLKEKAKASLVKFSNLKVILVMGEPEEQLVGERLYQVLAHKKKVVFLKNVVDYKIAYEILREVKSETEVCIVRCDIFSVDAVRRIIDMISPDIVVQTSVVARHKVTSKKLHGSLDFYNTINESLPKKALLLVNGTQLLSYRKSSKLVARNNENKTTARKRFYYLLDEKSQLLSLNNCFTANTIYSNGIETTFQVTFGESKINFACSLAGRMNIEDLLPSLFVALRLGFSDQELTEIVYGLDTLPRFMKSYAVSAKSLLVDNTHPINERSVDDTLSWMKLQKGNKILVMTPLQLYSPYSEELHFNFGKKIASLCDYLFVTNTDFKKQIVKGIYSSGGGCSVRYGNTDNLVSQIRKILETDNDVIVFQGTESGNILNHVLKILQKEEKLVLTSSV